MGHTLAPLTHSVSFLVAFPLSPRPMPQSAPIRKLTGLSLLLLLAACGKSDATPVPAKAAAAGGDVSAPPAAPAMAGKLTDSISMRADRGRIQGADTAQVWVREISDFQCPYCKQWHDETYAALDREFVKTGAVRMAYMNFPIPSLHQNALAASEAAMCASVQGKFWEMHGSLFTTQAAWAKLPDPSHTFDSLAVAAGVDHASWQSCVTNHATLPLINADRDRLGAIGIGSTPTFLIGDRKIVGAYPIDSMRTIINDQIRKARAGK